MATSFDEVDQLALKTIRTLAMDAGQKANADRPGEPMGRAPVAWTLFSRALRHDPADPGWSEEVQSLVPEAGVVPGWHRYAGLCGDIVCLDRYGASAPGATVAAKLGLSVEAVVERALALVESRENTRRSS